MNELEVGSPAPDFCLPDMDEKNICLRDFKGHFVVVYFYPRDNTSACTLEAKNFTEEEKDFSFLLVPVIGISPDPPQSHRKFIEKQGLKVHLLSDTSHAVLENYGIISKNREKVDIGKRAFLFISGILALFLWAGFLLGPALVIVASLFPKKILAQEMNILNLGKTMKCDVCGERSTHNKRMSDGKRAGRTKNVKPPYIFSHVSLSLMHCGLPCSSGSSRLFWVLWKLSFSGSR